MSDVIENNNNSSEINNVATLRFREKELQIGEQVRSFWFVRRISFGFLDLPDAFRDTEIPR
jgi:hypothetical protein